MNVQTRPVQGGVVVVVDGEQVRTDDGWEVVVRPMASGRFRVLERRARFELGRWWCYDTFAAAVLAVAAWDGAGVPVGWSRKGGGRQAR